ncbi:MAG: hypothetical protein AAGA90_14555 [Actinomycetota bacterium]
MTDVLLQLLVALAAALAVGGVLGFTLGAHRRPNAPDPPIADDGHLGMVVAREASLIEALARADADLHARARELAVANEEITCLLEQLHEARLHQR